MTFKLGISCAVAAAVGLLAMVAPTAGDDCLDCHDVEPAALEASAHGFLECLDCHAAAADLPHGEAIAEPACADCHDAAVEELRRSIHGRVLEKAGKPWIVGCRDCHGETHTLEPASEPDSPVHHARLAKTCGRCHADPEMARRSGVRRVQPLEAYLGSVHARSLAAGNGGADCGSCHGNHLILPAADPGSSVNHRVVSHTCGACHQEIAATYAASVHGVAAEAGVRESPVCTDCHGEHHILSPREKGSPVYATNIPRLTCGRCHSDLRLAEKYGMSTEKVPAYADSYHGLAVRSGSVTVAHCASCHGVHDIQPSSNPTSHVHKQNLAATCGQCHPGAGATFAIGTVHVLPTQPEHAAVYWARWIYLWLIALTIGGMVLHNGLDLYRKARHPPPRSLAAAAGTVERMSPLFRLTHGLLAGSFIVLVYSGFALTYPEAWWSAPLLQWEDRIAFRGWVHRGAALVLLGAGLLHVVHLARSRAARRCILSMRPGRSDWEEIRHRMRYLFGRTPEAPRAEWLGYGEKVEYLAVVWGTLVMTVTGLALWFENWVLYWLPGWVAQVATVIHFYEAVLASLAILVWHFYAVIFDPVVYPMDTAWLTGRSAPGRELERRPPPKPRRSRAKAAAPEFKGETT